MPTVVPKMADSWPAPKCAKFENESVEAYRRRVAEIAKIQDGFRMGRYRGDVAEHMERRLLWLEEQPFLDVRSA